MSTFRPYKTVQTWHASLKEHTCGPEVEMDDICAFCYGEQDLNTAPSDRCIGPPFRMPCCKKIFGATCVTDALNRAPDGKVNVCPWCKATIFKRRSREDFIERYVGAAISSN